MLIAVLTGLALITTALGSGVLFGVALANVPGFVALPADEYVRVHQLLDRHYEPTMPVVVLTAMALDAVLAIGSADPARRLVHAAAGLLLLGVVLISVLVNVPMLRGVRRADPDALPLDWIDPRPRWRAWNTVRTAFAVLALALTATAAVIR
jgi:uncharacterized membrane protein